MWSQDGGHSVRKKWNSWSACIGVEETVGDMPVCGIGGDNGGL
jgi:hypothetical protein